MHAYRSAPAYDRLKDLLISGKSGTMLPSTACSSAGQFCQDGSCGWQRRTRPAAPACSATSTSPRQPWTPAQAARARRRIGQRDTQLARGSASEQAALQLQRFENLLEANHDARRDIAIAMRHDPGGELIIGRKAGMHARVHRMAAGARGKPDHAQRRRGARREVATVDAAVLQAGVVIVDHAQRAQLGFQAVGFGEQAVTAGAVDIHGDAAGHDAVHQVGWPNSALARSRSSLSRENCARPKASPPSLPMKPRSPR